MSIPKVVKDVQKLLDMDDKEIFDVYAAITHYVETFKDGVDNDDKRMRVVYLSILDFIDGNGKHRRMYPEAFKTFLSYIEYMWNREGRGELKSSLKKLKDGFVNFWVLSRPYDSRQEYKLLLDVAGDGSCFFQCLFYSLFSVLPKSTLEKITDMKSLKEEILNRLFKSDAKFASEKAAEDVRKLFTHIKDKNSAAKYLGLDLQKKEYNKFYNAEMETLYLAAYAFNVQIVVYNLVEEYQGLLCAEFFFSTTNEDHFTGEGVVTLLYNGDNYNGHYRIISRYPLMGCVDAHGHGIPFVKIPKELYITNGNNFQLLRVQKCLSCNKTILS